MLLIRLSGTLVPVPTVNSAGGAGSGLGAASSCARAGRAARARVAIERRMYIGLLISLTPSGPIRLRTSFDSQLQTRRTRLISNGDADFRVCAQFGREFQVDLVQACPTGSQADVLDKHRI